MNFFLNTSFDQLYIDFAIIQLVQPIRDLSNKPENSDPSKPSRLRDLIFIPIGCLIRSPLLILIIVAAAFLLFRIIYTNNNWDFLGLAAPDYFNWEISPGFSEVTSPARKTWKLTYETESITTFSGQVRHITPIREYTFPLLTHDVLITRGDYADPDIVNIFVSNHRFSWQAKGVDSLTGSINLLHTIPQDEETYQVLLNIRKGDWVKVTGREILSLDYFNYRGYKMATWEDAGCNSILVTKVKYIDPPN
jgi:hypothetical protein